MSSKEIAEREIDEKRWSWQDLLIALFLFAATAGVVIWQNHRLGVLWDASYILENSYRISLGDLPYRNFPFPYAPLTFLVQAALIKLTGRVFWHHIAYGAVVGGAASVLAWRVLLNTLRGTVPRPRLLAFLLSLPLVVLGIYCIFPHPFYDPDSAFFILICLYLLQRLERKGWRSWPAFLTGIILVVPLFIKQNIGLTFLGSAVLSLIALIVMEAWRRQRVRGYVWSLAGVAAGLSSGLLLIQLTVGLDNYVRWTIRFAAARRTPPLADMLAIYQNRLLIGWLIAFLGGAILWWLNRRGRRTLAMLSAFLMSLPFTWAVIYLFIDQDSSEQAERLLGVWPFVLVLSFVLTIFSLRRRKGVALFLPFIIICTVHGTFLSQQLWGSTYGIWPLLLLLIASLMANLLALIKREQSEESSAWLMIPLACIVAVSLLVAGGHYTWAHERLDYANLSDGEMAHSKLAALRGLSLRGSWIPDFEELVGYVEQEIPDEEGILMIPGEDLFYYTTGRRPRFPVLMFDRTVNPYSPQEVLELARERDIRWLIVKQDLQLEDEQVEQDRDRLVEALKQDFKQVESLNNYDIYRRKTGSEDEDDDDDEDDGSDN